jgi:hypothetical protein
LFNLILNQAVWPAVGLGEKQKLLSYCEVIFEKLSGSYFYERTPHGAPGGPPRASSEKFHNLTHFKADPKLKYGVSSPFAY